MGKVVLELQKVDLGSGGHESIASLTPMLRQYFTLKSQVLDAILFFRMGDFYEIFGKDAELVAPMLEIVLSSRDRFQADKGTGDSLQGKIPFCGVPHHSAKSYWLKLLKRGMKIAIADQTEDPALAKGLVKREITRVLSPGVIDELEGLESDSQNYLLGTYPSPDESGKWVVAMLDVSIGELRSGVMSNFEELVDFIRLIGPKEILVRRVFRDELVKAIQGNYGKSELCFGDLAEGTLRDPTCHLVRIKRLIGNDSEFISPESIALLAALFDHLERMKISLDIFKCILPLTDPQSMKLSETLIRDLEIFETSRRRHVDGSLYQVLNSTLSPMGARLLRRSLIEPLLNRSLLEERLDDVERYVKRGEESLGEIRSILKGFPDLERLSLKLHSKKMTPQELAKIRLSLRKVTELSHSLRTSKGGPDLDIKPGLVTDIRPLLSLLEAALEETPLALGSGAGVFRTGYDTDLDSKRQFAQEGEQLTFNYQETLKQKTGITSLKIKSQKNYGLLIEVTKTNRSKIPQEFIHKQTMVNADRFTTTDLQDLSEKLECAIENCVQREAFLYDQLLGQVNRFTEHLKQIANYVAYSDMIISFAWNALRRQYVRPLWSDSEVHLKKSRHPVVEVCVGEYGFYPNDIVLNQDKKQILLTGPNMAGKSTVMRQVAVIGLMAQIGSFVPASEAKLPIFDRIFTRIGAADDIARGQSTFMVEMSEAAQILRHSTQKSLVILDEIGRGTSSQDGLALAAAILNDIAERVGCFTLFATHYHELVKYAEGLPSILSMQIEVVEKGDSITFTHRLKEGATGSSYGIEVAKIAGIPLHVVEIAKKLAIGGQKFNLPISKEMSIKGDENGQKKKMGVPKTKFLPPLEDSGLIEVPLGQESQKLELSLEKIKRINLYRITPIQAMNILEDLQRSLSPGFFGSTEQELPLS